MKNPAKRKDWETEPTLPCFITSISQYLSFFELHIKVSCVFILLLIFISLMLLASLTQRTPDLHLFWLLVFFLMTFMWVFGEVVFIFPCFPRQLSLTLLQAQISTEVFHPATLPLSLLNRKLSENQMKNHVAGDKIERTLSSWWYGQKRKLI